MGDIIEVRSLRVKTPYQPVGMLIQPAFPGMIWPGKVDRCPRDFCNFPVLGKFRTVVSSQGFKLAEGIGNDVPEGRYHCLCSLVGQFANDDQLDGFIDHRQQE